jgi:hypothetical protein
MIFYSDNVCAALLKLSQHQQMDWKEEHAGALDCAPCWQFQCTQYIVEQQRFLKYIGRCDMLIKRQMKWLYTPRVVASLSRVPHYYNRSSQDFNIRKRTRWRRRIRWEYTQQRSSSRCIKKTKRYKVQHSLLYNMWNRSAAGIAEKPKDIYKKEVESSPICSRIEIASRE